MKREVERQKRLPAFAVSISELEVLESKLKNLFDQSDRVYGSIDIDLPLEKLSFGSVSELKKFPSLPDRITRFSIWFSQGERRVSIRGGGLFVGPFTVYTTGETEIWCAGAIEAAYTFFQSNKLWYHWLASAPIGWLLFLFANMMSVLLGVYGAKINKPLLLGWLLVVITLAMLYFAKDKLFPAAVIRVRETEGFIHKYAAELSFTVGIVALVVNILGWLMK